MKKEKLITLLLTLLSALLLIISTAGFGISITVFFAFIPLLFAVKRNNIHPIILGWIVGFLYWTICLSWMLTTFSYFGNAPIYGSIALLLFISITGGFLFFAPFTYIARKYEYQPLLLAVIFIILEVAKSTLFFGGVPWLNLAQSQYKNLIFVQSVSVIGEYGLSLIIMLINLFTYYIITNYKRKAYSIALAVIILIMIAPGVYRELIPLQIDNIARVKVIQTGHKQEEKWIQNKRLSLINNLNQRLMAIDRKNYDLIILPESSYPARVLDTPYILDVIQNIAFDTPVIIGTDTVAPNKKLGKIAHYNSMVLFDNSTTPSIYNKRRLTPFGEYFPFEKFLYPLRVFFFGTGEMYTPGDEPKVFVTGNIKIAPLICWEGAFYNLVGDTVKNGANFIAMISNDTWFGSVFGRSQHLAVDTIRAVEYQRSMARATQDGISAMIMPNGEIVASTELATPQDLDYDLPLVSQRSIFTNIGYSYLFIIGILAIIILIRSKKRES